MSKRLLYVCAPLLQTLDQNSIEERKIVAVFFDGGIEPKGERGKKNEVRLVPRRL